MNAVPLAEKLIQRTYRTNMPYDRQVQSSTLIMLNKKFNFTKKNIIVFAEKNFYRKRRGIGVTVSITTMIIILWIFGKKITLLL